MVKMNLHQTRRLLASTLPLLALLGALFWSGTAERSSGPSLQSGADAVEPQKEADPEGYSGDTDALSAQEAPLNLPAGALEESNRILFGDGPVPETLPAIGPDGQPLLDPDGQPLMINVDDYRDGIPQPEVEAAFSLLWENQVDTVIDSVTGEEITTVTVVPRED